MVIFPRENSAPVFPIVDSATAGAGVLQICPIPLLVVPRLPPGEIVVAVGVVLLLLAEAVPVDEYRLAREETRKQKVDVADTWRRRSRGRTLELFGGRTTRTKSPSKKISVPSACTATCVGAAVGSGRRCRMGRVEVEEGTGRKGDGAVK